MTTFKLTDNTCNGWRNAATSTVNLWFGDAWAEMADEGVNITAEFCCYQVEDYVYGLIGPGYGFIWDMLDLRAVDWEGLAEHQQRTQETTT